MVPKLLYRNTNIVLRFTAFVKPHRVIFSYRGQGCILPPRSREGKGSTIQFDTRGSAKVGSKTRTINFRSPITRPLWNRVAAAPPQPLSRALAVYKRDIAQRHARHLGPCRRRGGEIRRPRAQTGEMPRALRFGDGDETRQLGIDCTPAVVKPYRL